MVSRIVVDEDGRRWRIEGTLDHYATGERMVVFTRYYTIDELLDKGCGWNSPTHWALPVEEFRLRFRWTDESTD